MTFEEAWNAFQLGDMVKVRKGGPPPSSNKDGIPYKAWASHNFTGQLVEKIDGEWRSMRFELPPTEEGNIIGYTIVEGVGHVFTAS